MRHVGLFAAFGVVLALVLWLVLTKPSNSPQTAPNASIQLKPFEDTAQGVKMDYPTTATLTELSDEDRTDRFILIANGNDNGIPYKLYLKYEEGLEVAAAVTKVSVLDFMIQNLERSYPKLYPDYAKISERRFQLNGKEAAELDFNYKASGESVKQRVVIVNKDGNKALYLSMQAKTSDFEKLQPTFQATTDTLDFL